MSAVFPGPPCYSEPWEKKDNRRRRKAVVEKKTSRKETPCLICGKPSPQSICLACQARVRGEALDQKKKVEKKGSTDKGRQ